MEALGAKARNLYGPVVTDVQGVGKRSLEWDLNDWKWDGDLFTASRLNSVVSDCRSRQLFPAGQGIPSNAGFSNGSSSGSDDVSPWNEKGKRETEKRRRGVLVENEELHDEGRSLNLNLGGQVYPIVEGEVNTGKKTKIVGTSSSRAVCQVEDCKADLSSAKDYHRRHKVCVMHSKASESLVGNAMQRFCQQCSRFHFLKEFDEGKRSCRRRLAGHNKRRRKTVPDTAVTAGSLNDETGSSYLLFSLLRILSNMHANGSDQTKDQDLLSHMLKSLANPAGTVDGRNISALLQASQGLSNSGSFVKTAEKLPVTVSNMFEPSRPSVSASSMDDCVIIEEPPRHIGQFPSVPASDLLQKRTSSVDGDLGNQILPGLYASKPLPSRESSPTRTVAPEYERIQLHEIDLNSPYEDSQDYLENLGNSDVPVNPVIQDDSHKSSPPQTSGTSDSTFTQSLSSSSGESQNRTDRISFKFFGKSDPSDLPFGLRSQVMHWLSKFPTEIESYIRPGCIILTIYLRLEKSMWEELCCHLGSSLKRLIDAADDPFWRTGWVYTRMQHSVAFMHNGQVVLDTLLPLKSHSRISSIRPIAVSFSETAQFVVKGFNLPHSTTRLLCALEGKYLPQEACDDLMDGADTTVEHDELQCARFSCSIPNVTGRGFIEVEDLGLSSSFFPFIVAEQEVCSEICMLEDAIEEAETVDGIQAEPELIEAKNQAMDFIHEMGWLLHRSHVKFRLGHLDPNLDLFPFGRFKLLMEFSVDRDWCAVVKKLLKLLFESTVDAGEHPSIELALLDMALLHRAVRRNCRRMVELLLRFVPHKGLESEDKKQVDGESNRLFFKPDDVGPLGLTPLHVAASIDGCEYVLDALTDDPGKVGIEAWKNARDSTGMTPYDYASRQGHHSYINLVQRKISKKLGSGHVVLDIPSVILQSNSKQKQSDGHRSSKVASFDTEKFDVKALIRGDCKLCSQRLAYTNTRPLVYRPAMLSMVAIAAVCVCVALLFKSTPEVVFIFHPFRWEHLKFGSS